MNYAATTSSSTKTGFVARVRALVAQAWSLHLQTCQIVAEAHRRPQ